MTDLVPTNPGALSVPGKQVALDEHPGMVDRYLKAKKAAAYWKEQLEDLHREIVDLIGDAEVATLNGDSVFTLKPTASFNESRFRKENPELHKLYLHNVSREELDLELLQRARPDIYAQYQVRPLRTT